MTILAMTAVPAVACSSNDQSSEDLGTTNAAVTLPTSLCKVIRRGNIDNDSKGTSDIALTGGTIPCTSGTGKPWASLPVAFSNGDGSFRVTNTAIAGFGGLAAVSKATVMGDFNGDHKADIALLGGPTIGNGTRWNTVPVAFSNGDGSFNVTNLPDGSLPGWVLGANPVYAVGDFNGDGRDDVVLAGGSGWNTIPVAFSNGDGSFHETNYNMNSTFANLATSAGGGVTLVTGNFNCDGLTDIALIPSGNGSSVMQVGLSNGDGTFNFSSRSIPNVTAFSNLSTGAHIAVIAGDFNGDALTDLALVGGLGWNTIPVALQNTDGSFSVTNDSVANFPGWATVGDNVVAGDYDGDGKTDLALTGGYNWASIPVAFSNGDGSFRVTNTSVTNFPGWAREWAPSSGNAPFPPAALSATGSELGGGTSRLINTCMAPPAPPATSPPPPTTTVTNPPPPGTPYCSQYVYFCEDCHKGAGFQGEGYYCDYQSANMDACPSAMVETCTPPN